ncbi:hypothetical protein [Psychrobacillus lasiicapitis]|uniref:DUF4871 domain-containing protein n=1 Tax=Psychrobacillus lasiicapitis TaxID=1636719 RepID=A0A544SV59_9BACI|nr:hypothetical protein [Psychrobacillus lasiicapitis]TQR09094.1 hypothetical protein FG382_20055 [Psychrobacillus lasiicapitis]GGA47465.1 hypothetical protein GCM10011384_41440 [Psychrobacillus lasiicapitis]
MEDYKELQNRLRNLPKYSLENEQKEKLLYTLRAKQNIVKKPVLLKPIFTIVAICSILLLLLLTHEDYYKLSAQQGTVFTLPDRDQEVLGVEGRIGILVFNEQFVAEDKRRVSKMMLYFWGDEHALVDKKFRVEAVNIKREKIVLTEGVLSSGLYSEDAHTLARFIPFPSEGEWQLSFYVEDVLFEAFTVNVFPPFPKTENYALVDSPKEIPIGEAYEVYLQSTLGEKEIIEVKLLDNKGRVMETTVFKQDNSVIDGEGGGIIYYYKGNLTWKDHGMWKLLIDGEQTRIFEN